MSDFLPKTERRNIRHDFTATETHDLSLELAAKTRELAGVKEEKKSAGAQYTAKEKEIQALLGRLSNQITDGWEFRERILNIEYHKPETGKKTLTDPETGKVIVERMTEYEYNLFNQPQDDDNEVDDHAGNPEADPNSDKYDSVKYGPRDARLAMLNSGKKSAPKNKGKKGGKAKTSKVKPTTAEPAKETQASGKKGGRRKLTDLAAEVIASVIATDLKETVTDHSNEPQAF